MKKWFKCDLGLITDRGEIITEQDIKELIKERDKYFQEIERLNNIIKEYEINTIPALEHNIDVLVDSESRLNNIINELEKYINSTKNWYINLDDKLMEKPYIFIKDLRNKLKELKEGKK